MKTWLKTAIAIVFCLSFLADTVLADNFSFRLSANQKALDTAIDGEFDLPETKLMTGISGVYDNDDYKLLFLNGLIANRILIDGLTGGFGFKGVWGETEKHRLDLDVLNLGFMAYVSYDFAKTELKDYSLTPLSIGFCLAPEPLSFADTREFLEFTAECGWKIQEQTAVVLNYRYIEIDLDNPHEDRQKSDSTAYLGLKFFF
jgi:hypothetical protein